MFKVTITVHFSVSMLTLYKFGSFFKLCDMSVPDFSKLQGLPSFGSYIHGGFQLMNTIRIEKFLPFILQIRALSNYQTMW